MKRLIGLAGICLLVFATPACSGADASAEERRDITQVAKNDPAMTAAIAEARRTLPEFLAALAKPPAGASGFVFKYPLGGTEHIWVDNVARRGDRLTGRLANAPLQEGFGEGDAVSVPLAEVSDWGYRRADGVMLGHRTTRVQLPQLEPAQAAAIREAFGWTE